MHVNGACYALRESYDDWYCRLMWSEARVSLTVGLPLVSWLVPATCVVDDRIPLSRWLWAVPILKRLRKSPWWEHSICEPQWQRGTASQGQQERDNCRRAAILALKTSIDSPEKEEVYPLGRAEMTVLRGLTRHDLDWLFPPQTPCCQCEFHTWRSTSAATPSLRRASLREPTALTGRKLPTRAPPTPRFTWSRTLACPFSPCW